MQIKQLFFVASILLIFVQITQTRHHTYTKKKPFIIMLDPAGDAKKTGRIIGHTFERGLTLQFAEKLKEILEQQTKNITVYLTRSPGEIVYPLKNANYANRLQVKLYVNINFYQEKSIIPKLFLYRFSYQDDLISTQKKFALYTYDQAHFFSNETTNLWANIIKDHLRTAEYKKLFKVQGIYKIPFKPLIGIQAPAIGIEGGLKQSSDWQLYVTPIAQALINIVGMS